MLYCCLCFSIPAGAGGRRGGKFYRSTRGAPDLIAITLGLKYTGDPRWFYNLTPEERINVLALSRIENNQEPKRYKRKGGPLSKQVNATDGARTFWMGD